MANFRIADNTPETPSAYASLQDDEEESVLPQAEMGIDPNVPTLGHNLLGWHDALGQDRIHAVGDDC
jgi:hypothetical protein